MLYTMLLQHEEIVVSLMGNTATIFHSDWQLLWPTNSRQSSISLPKNLIVTLEVSQYQNIPALTPHVSLAKSVLNRLRGRYYESQSIGEADGLCQS